MHAFESRKETIWGKKGRQKKVNGEQYEQRRLLRKYENVMVKPISLYAQQHILYADTLYVDHYVGPADWTGVRSVNSSHWPLQTILQGFDC